MQIFEEMGGKYKAGNSIRVDGDSESDWFAIDTGELEEMDSIANLTSRYLICHIFSFHQELYHFDSLFAVDYIWCRRHCDPSLDKRCKIELRSGGSMAATCSISQSLEGHRDASIFFWLGWPIMADLWHNLIDQYCMRLICNIDTVIYFAELCV